MKVPALSSKKFCKILEKNGAYLVRQGATDHAVFVREILQRKFAAPVQMGKKELNSHYIKLVLKQLGFSSQEIESIFRK